MKADCAAVAASSVADLWERYRVAFENRGGKGAWRLKICWAHLKPHFETMRVEQVSTDAVERYIAARKAEGASNGTVNREVVGLRAAFHHGARVTPPMVNRVPAFPSRLKESKPREGVTTDEQHAVLARKAKQPWLRGLLAIGYFFGFRKGEMLALRVSQLDFFGRWIQLDSDQTKNGHARKVRMTEEVYRSLLACVRGQNPDDYVFTRDGSKSRIVDFRKDWYSLTAACGLAGLHVHDLRRSAVRNLVGRGFPKRSPCESVDTGLEQFSTVTTFAPKAT